jgi:adenine/guanine/hypoxanthine permease
MPRRRDRVKGWFGDLVGAGAAPVRPRTEVVAGLTTFLTMAYIIFVQPAVLSGSTFGTETGMDFGAVTTATCLSAAAATAIMGLYARYPIALAPGMGQNVFFVLTAVPLAASTGASEPWRVALGAVFVAGLMFVAVSVLGVREKIFDAVSPSMKVAIAVGIGLFIAFIGLRNGGVVVDDPGTAVKLNPAFLSPDVLIFVVGFMVAAILQVRRVTGAIIWGIGTALLLSLVLRMAMPHLPAALTSNPVVAGSALVTQFTIADGVLSLPPSIRPTLLQLDVARAFSGTIIPAVIMFFFMDVFDTMGTLIGVSQEAGLLVDGKLPRIERAMTADALGTVVGALLGTSTVTSYIESAAGVEHGGRTGLTALTVSVFFILALFCYPIVEMVGSYPPITAPALVLVGAMMTRHVSSITWSDPTEGIPAFLTVIGIPLFYSIADGLSLGLVSYPVLKAVSGRRREVGWTMWVLAGAVLAYFVFIRSRI